MSFKNILYLCGKIVIIMALNLRRNFKTYYSIREVAEMFDLNESTLRYWEQEFSLGFKISAARDILQKNRKGAETTAKALSELIEMRTELEKLRDHLDML